MVGNYQSPLPKESAPTLNIHAKVGEGKPGFVTLMSLVSLYFSVIASGSTTNVSKQFYL